MEILSKEYDKNLNVITTARLTFEEFNRAALSTVPPVPSDDDGFGPAPTNAELGLSTVPPVPGPNIIDDVEDLISFYQGEHIYFTDVRDGCCPKSDRCDPVVLVNEFVSELKKLLRSPSVAPVPIHISNGLSVSSEANPTPAAVKDTSLKEASEALRDYLVERDYAGDDGDIPNEIWLPFIKALTAEGQKGYG
jgi:hypothetical protein